MCYAVFVGKTSLRMEFLWLKISSPAPCVESVPLHAHAVATKRIIAWSVTWTGRGLKTLLSRACAPVCGSRVCARVRVCACARSRIWRANRVGDTRDSERFQEFSRVDFLSFAFDIMFFMCYTYYRRRNALT